MWYYLCFMSACVTVYAGVFTQSTCCNPALSMLYEAFAKTNIHQIITLYFLQLDDSPLASF